MNLFFEYSLANDIDREDIVFNSIIENKVDKCFLALEKAAIEHESNCRKIELQLLTESSTYEDAERLYLEEEEKSNVKQKGIIGSLLDALGKLLSKIKKTLFGEGDTKKEVKEEDFPEKHNFEEDPRELLREGNEKVKILDEGMNAFDKIKEYVKEHPIKSIGAALLFRKAIFSEYNKYERFVNTVEQRKTAWQKFEESEALKDSNNVPIFSSVFKRVMEIFTKLEVLGKLPDKKYSEFKKNTKNDTDENDKNINLSEEDINKAKKRLNELDTLIKNKNEEIDALKSFINTGKPPEDKKFLDKINIFKKIKNLPRKLDMHDLQTYNKWKNNGKQSGFFHEYDKANYNKLVEKYGSEIMIKLDRLKIMENELENLRKEREECLSKVKGHTTNIVNRENDTFKKNEPDRMKSDSLNKPDDKNQKDDNKDENKDKNNK